MQDLPLAQPSSDARRWPRSALHVWTHDVTAKTGGIQSYSLALINALGEICPPRRVTLCFKNERGLPGAIGGDFRVRSYGHLSPGLRTLAFSAGILRAALFQRPKLILSVHPNFARLGVATAKLSHSAFWTAAHGIDVWEDASAAVRWALRRCQRILAVSEFTKRKMIQCHGISEALISVLPNTFDAERFQPGRPDDSERAALGVPPAGKILLSVGRLAEPGRMKGFDKIIQAMPAILQAVPDAYYLLAGQGPDRPRLEQMAVACGVRERVIFAGFVPDSRLAALYQSSDAFVMPSKKEGFGIVFLEALACGVPVIAGNVDASGEPLLGGELGILVNPDDVPEIARACISLLTRAHPSRHFFEPGYLSRRVTDAFGPGAFRQSLQALLNAYAPQVLETNE